MVVCLCIWLMWGKRIFDLATLPVSALIMVVPLLYGARRLDGYSLNLSLGMLVYLVADILSIINFMVPYALIAYLVGHVFLVRAFFSFQGYIFSSSRLIITLLVTTTYCFAIYEYLKQDSWIIIGYAYGTTFMWWQGINQFAIRKSYGSFYIFLAMFFHILLNVFKGLYMYFSPLEYLDVLFQVTYWISMLLLAYSSTLQYRKFFTRI